MKSLSIPFQATLLGIVITTTLAAMPTTPSKGDLIVDFSFNALEIDTIGAETVTSYDITTNSVTTDGNPKAYSLSQFQIKHLPNFAQFVESGDLTGSTPILNSFHKREHLIRLNYGLTDKLSLSSNIPFIDNTLTYTNDYVEELQALNSNPNNDALITVPPLRAQARGISDITLGAAYKLTQNLTLSSSFKGGLLKVGKAANEIEISDGKEELETGKAADYTTVSLNYRIPFQLLLLTLQLSHEHSGKGVEKFLDNDFIIDAGNISTLRTTVTIPVLSSLSLQSQLTYQHSEADKLLNDESKWVEIQGSESRSTHLKLSIIQYPKERLALQAGYCLLLQNDVTGGLYDSPGRLSHSNAFHLGLTILFDN